MFLGRREIFVRNILNADYPGKNATLSYRCHRDGLPFRDSYQPRKCYYRSVESVGSVGEGGWTPEPGFGGLSTQPSSATVEKNITYFTQMCYSTLNVASNKRRSSDLPDGLTAAGVAILFNVGK